jgi:hypothetical protein
VLIPLATVFGAVDDTERARIVDEASPAQIKELKTAITTHNAALDAWLAGPEAKGPKYSPEYLAFSAMRMAADYA